MKPSVAIVGGGAAGFFAAIHAAEGSADRGRSAPSIVLLEQGARVLGKVAISGGGRCNVTHHCFDPALLCRHYPRGSKELRGTFHRFQPSDTMRWFETRGVPLKTEADGRVFPVTDDSASVVGCLQQAAHDAGVEVRTRSGVRGFTPRTAGGFDLELASGDTLACDVLMIASGSLREGAMATALRSAGHSIAPLAPSLFTFHIEDQRLAGLAGLAVEGVEVSVEGTKLKQSGPVLVTHWGLSGPAILRLSAWGARELQSAGYQFMLRVNWLGGRTPAQVVEILRHLRSERARQVVMSHPHGVPRRLWQRLALAAGIDPETTWSHLPKDQEQALAEQLSASRFAVTDKSLNKEEFVTCGGIDKREIDFRTMKSRIVQDLYFGGEVIDIDGVTGGFNLQAAWTTGFIAGTAIAGQLA